MNGDTWTVTFILFQNISSLQKLMVRKRLQWCMNQTPCVQGKTLHFDWSIQNSNICIPHNGGEHFWTLFINTVNIYHQVNSSQVQCNLYVSTFHKKIPVLFLSWPGSPFHCLLEPNPADPCWQGLVNLKPWVDLSSRAEPCRALQLAWHDKAQWPEQTSDSGSHSLATNPCCTVAKCGLHVFYF